MQMLQATDCYSLWASQETNKFTLWTKRKTVIFKLCSTHSYSVNLKTSYPVPYRQYEIRIDVFDRHEANLTANDATVSSTDHASDVIRSDVLDTSKIKLGDVACTIHQANTKEKYGSPVHVLGLSCTGGCNRCDYRAAQMKHTVVCGSARTGDYLNLAMKKSEHVSFQGRHDCRLTTACTNETRRNIRATNAPCF
jgi:hypothetical protein